ncbi:MAG: hypothetical protein AUI50_01500 [Crenarchaeota archaeon 13_1_40CM_2_52_14]|nr:MAG: hypothetical protein AUI97_09325 [Crenarchaeota archaeon 13_1_40CM_3_52_17]OLD35596.1 MAG: hypothetical protein AUI50_01500 [Crenarchaeota archaeon 13_1_40CM_2_52_14]
MDLATKKMVYYGLLGLLIAGSTIAVFRVAPQVAPVQFLAKDGTFAVYFNSIPSDIQSNQGMSNVGQMPGTLPVNPHLPQVLTVVSLNVTIDSITFHRSGGNDSGWTNVPHAPVTLDLLQRTSVSVLIDSVKIPSENVTMVELHISDATATVSVLGVLTVKQVIVSSENLKIPIDSGASVEPQMTTSIVADRPHIVVEGNGTIRLTPVLNVDSINGPK